MEINENYIFKIASFHAFPFGNSWRLGKICNLRNLGKFWNFGNFVNLGNLGNFGNLENLGNSGKLGKYLDSGFSLN